MIKEIIILNKYLSGNNIINLLRKALNIIFCISISSFIYQILYGQYEWLEKTLDVATSTPGDLLNSEIEILGGEKVLLRLQLKGTLPRGHDIDANLLEKEFAESFLYFAVNTSKVGYPVKEVDKLFAKETIGDIYVSRLKDLIKQAKTKEEKEILKEALYVGASYISKELEVD